MENFFKEIHEINSRLRSLHLKMMGEVESVNEEQYEVIENYLFHTSYIANSLIEFAESKTV